MNRKFRECDVLEVLMFRSRSDACLITLYGVFRCDNVDYILGSQKSLDLFNSDEPRVKIVLYTVRDCAQRVFSVTFIGRSFMEVFSFNKKT
jgi:hypothetical protein